MVVRDRTVGGGGWGGRGIEKKVGLVIKGQHKGSFWE